jgi:hypothetical protein
MLLIARFYQKFSGERTYFWYYSGVVVFFGAIAVRYASVGIVIGDWVTDILSIIAGVSLLILCVVLYWRMMRQPENS